MHYCQQCPDLVPMVPYGDLAICPGGHGSEPAVRQPLFVVTGASGSGKTTIHPLLAADLRECAVFDADWLIDSFGMACAPGPINWTAFRDAWLSIAHAAAQGGRATVLLSPFLPEQLEELPARPWIGDLHFALLDCSDHTRRERLNNRPVWRLHDLDEQLAFASHLRTQVTTVVSTEHSPVAASSEISNWVRACLANTP